MMKSKPLTRKLLQGNTDKLDRVDPSSPNPSQRYHDADAALPTSSTPPHQTSASHIPPHARRSSSFYSQPEILYPVKFTNPWEALESPQKVDIRTTQRNIQGGNTTEAPRINTQAQAQNYSYRSQRTLGTNRQQHTAVSEYIAARSWTQETPPSLQPAPASPSSRPLYLLWDNITGTIRRKSSLFTLSTGRSGSLAGRDAQLNRRASSVCSTSSAEGDFRPENFFEASSPLNLMSQHDTDKIQRNDSIAFTKKPVYPSNDASSVYSKEQSWADMQKRSQYRPQTPSSPAPSYTAKTLPIHTSYGEYSPHPTIPRTKQQPPIPTDARAALLRGLSQTYSSDASASARSSAKLQQQHPSLNSRSSNNTFKPSLWSTDPIPAPTGHYRPPPPRPGAKILQSQTKDSRCCDQGKFLGIGTMRAVSPAGVDMLQGWMMSSLRKTKDTERGMKEVRKWLKHQDRATVEWVGDWLYFRWGCQL